MIRYGKNKKNNNRDNVLFVNGSADQLAMKDNSVDLITIAFGLRNFSDKENCIKECRRVLKYGKKIYVLEFSPSVNEIMILYIIFIQIK